MNMQDYRATMNYVTGTHNFKLGMDLQQGFRQNPWLDFTTPIQYRTLGYQLNQVTLFAPPGVYRSNLDYDAGIFAQDRWTMKRLTLTGAVRLDLQKESYDPTTIGPTLYTPNRPVQTIPGANVANWKDINPRFGVAYDLFGDGKTALKASAARGVAGETIATAAALNPGASFVTSTAINVIDSNHDNIPDCNFLNPPGKRGMRPMADADVWQRHPVDEAGSGDAQWLECPAVELGILGGCAAVRSCRVCPRAITYYRRINGGFLVTDNTSTTAADYTPYNLTVPTDPRLPTSGQTLTYYDVNPVLKSGVVRLDDDQPQHVRVELTATCTSTGMASTSRRTRGWLPV